MTAFPDSFSYGDTASLYIEYQKRSKSYSMTEDHYHSYYELYYLMSGKRVYFVRDRSYQVEQGDLVLIGKHELHKTMQAGLEAHERLLIHFTDELIEQLSGRHASLLLEAFQGESHVLRLPRADRLAIDETVRGMMREIVRKEPGYELLPPQAVVSLLLTAARHMRNHDFTPFQHASPLHAKISEIVRHINAHYNEPLRLADLSEQFYISPHYLSRMFKEVTGFAFSDYVSLTRIKEAQRLLRESELSVSDIAERVGFDNFSHFGKTFKKTVRLSPRDYRKLMSQF